ncbi:hypothetical protein EYF80_044091 [Liparis tanakae]|uniref:Uncharacterized protein n=1 Tax=Liparis tanakae TaxID=230148 RepID=A0A4Z2FXU3_9TELE|nr:hypothetical protein EYF80_044091 [Liparis tanakae]
MDVLSLSSLASSHIEKTFSSGSLRSGPADCCFMNALTIVQRTFTYQSIRKYRTGPRTDKSRKTGSVQRFNGEVAPICSKSRKAGKGRQGAPPMRSQDRATIRLADAERVEWVVRFDRDVRTGRDRKRVDLMIAGWARTTKPFEEPVQNPYVPVWPGVR